MLLAAAVRTPALRTSASACRALATSGIAHAAPDAHAPLRFRAKQQVPRKPAADSKSRSRDSSGPQRGFDKSAGSGKPRVFDSSGGYRSGFHKPGHYSKPGYNSKPGYKPGFGNKPVPDNSSGFKSRGSSKYDSARKPDGFKSTGKRENSFQRGNGWQGKRGRNEPSPPNFGPLEILNTKETITKVNNLLGDFSQNAYILDSLSAYGVTEEVAQLLMTHLDIGAHDHHDARVHTHLSILLSYWGSSTRAELKRASGSEAALEVLEEQGWPIEALRTNMVLETELKVVDRHLVNKFLAFVQTNLLNISRLADTPLPGRTIAINAAARIKNLLATLDYRTPMERFPTTRRLTREIHLHVGPTNSGKTHGALVRLMKARTGLYAGPLRLLAHEIWYRINAGQVAPDLGSRECNLLTGDEVRLGDGFVGLTSCTVEMLPAEQPVEVAVIDEIQMIADPSRGQAWTNALLGVAAKEIHLCGEASVVPLVKKISEACGDVVHVHEYQRLTPLKVADKTLENDFSRIKRGDCLVAFSRSRIFDIKRMVEEQTGLQCAIVYGGLPPETRAEQARLFNDPGSGYDVMVASDAIGMGLNLKIKRVVFDTLAKYDGVTGFKYLTASQIKQIAGRAGRYGVHDDDTVGSATTMQPQHLPILHAALDAPTQPIPRAAFNPPMDALSKLAELIDTPDSLNKRSTEPPAEARKKWSRSDAPEPKVASVISPQTEGMGRSLLALRKDAQMLVQLNEDLFFHSNINSQLHVLQVIEKASTFRSPEDSVVSTQAREDEEVARPGALPVGSDSGQSLSIQERERFSDAPANTRDLRVMYALQSFTRYFCMGVLVEFDKAIEASEMIQTLVRMEELEKEALEKAADNPEFLKPETDTVNPMVDLPPSWKSAGADSPAGGPSQKSGPQEPSGLSYGRSRNAAHFVDPDAPEVHIDSLTKLESLHRTCGLYLWLSYRFPLSFCFGQQVEDYKRRTEMMIQFTLEAIRIARAKRLQRLFAIREAAAAESNAVASSDSDY